MKTLEAIQLALAIYGCGLLFAIAGAAFLWQYVPRRGRFVIFAALIMGLHCVYPLLADKERLYSLFTIDPYLADAGCYSTNDTVRIALSRNVAELPIEGSDVWVFSNDRLNPTNELGEIVWNQLLPSYPFENGFSHDYTLVGATNFDYMVVLNYIPPAPVHTNGVFNLYGYDADNAGTNATRALFINTTVERIE